MKTVTEPVLEALSGQPYEPIAAPKFLEMGRAVRYRLSRLKGYIAPLLELVNSGERGELVS